MNQMKRFDLNKLQAFKEVLAKSAKIDNSDREINLEKGLDSSKEQLIREDVVPTTLEHASFLKENGLDKPLSFYCPYTEQFYDNAELKHVRVEDGEYFMNFTKDVTYNLDRLKGLVKGYEMSQLVLNKFSTAYKIDLSVGVFSHPEIGEITSDIKLIDTKKNPETGGFIFRFTSENGIFTLDQDEFVSQIKRAVVFKNHGFRMRYYKGIDNSNPGAKYELVGMSEQPGMVKMQLGNTIKEVPVFYIRAVIKNQEILNSEAEDLTVSKVEDYLKDFTKKLDRVKDFNGVRDLGSDLEALMAVDSQQVFGNYNLTHRTQFDQSRQNRVNEYNFKLEEFAPYNKGLESLSKVLRTVKRGVDVSVLQKNRSALTAVHKHLSQFKDADFLSIKLLNDHFTKIFDKVESGLELVDKKLEALDLFMNLNSAVRRINPAYPNAVDKLSVFSRRFNMLDSESTLDKIFDHVAAEIDQFRFKFLDGMYRNRKSRTSESAQLHAHFVELYDRMFNKLDGMNSTLCLRKNTAAFQENWLELIRKYEMLNFAKEADSLVQVTRISGQIETVEIKLQRDLSVLGDLSDTKANYGMFKGLEDDKNDEIANTIESQEALLEDIFDKGIKSLALAFGYKERDLNDGLVESLKDMVYSGKITMVLRKDEDSELQMEDIIRKIASLHDQAKQALNTNLKDFTAIYEEINMVFNLTIVRLNKSGISTVVHDHPEEVIHDKIRDVFRRAA